MNDKEEKIYDLIISKSFEELLKDEQAFVIENLGSAEAYAKMREANLAALEAMADDEPAPSDMKASVMEAFDQKSKKKRGIVWWKYAAAVAILAVGAFVFWPAGNPEKVQLAENVEREKPKTEAETQNETEQEESAAPSDSEDATDTSDRKEETVSSEGEQAPIGDKMIAEKIGDEEEMVAELNLPQMAEDSEPDDTPMIENDSEEEGYRQANSLADEAAPPEEPTVVKNFSSDEIQEISTSSMNESMRAKTSMRAGLEQVEGISLSQIGGPFPKAYVAY